MTEEGTSLVGNQTDIQTIVFTEHDYYYESSEVLASNLFLGVLWMLLLVGIIGNILVVMWRISRKGDQRASPLSILIIMLAVSDFLYCVHLFLMLSLIAESHLGQNVIWEQSSFRHVCIASGYLSLLSCVTSQWTIFSIAVYSLLAICEWCSSCRGSLLQKRYSQIAITCQVLVVIAVILFVFLSFSTSGLINANDEVAKQQFQYVDINGDNVNWTIYSNFSKRERITEIFERCAWAESIGCMVCNNGTMSDTESNHTDTSVYNYCWFSTTSLRTYDTASLVALLNTILTVACVFLYFLLFVKIGKLAYKANLTTISDIHKFQWRLSVIILLNTLCWIPVSVVNMMAISHLTDSWISHSTAANILLISISPAANPLIYTFTEKNFLQSIGKYWRRMTCDISLRRNSSNYHDDHIGGVERCSCIPCVRCVHRDEDYWNTEETFAWSSEESRLLPSIIGSRETT